MDNAQAKIFSAETVSRQNRKTSENSAAAKPLDPPTSMFSRQIYSRLLRAKSRNLCRNITARFFDTCKTFYLHPKL
jgi:hypothetical protein